MEFEYFLRLFDEFLFFWWNSCSFSDLLTELPFFLRSFEGILVFSAIFWRYSCFFRDLLEEIAFSARFFFITILWQNSCFYRDSLKQLEFLSRSFGGIQAICGPFSSDEILDLYRDPLTKLSIFSVGLQRRFFSHDSLIEFASFQRPTGEIPRVYAILCQNLYIYPFSTNDWRNRFFSCTSCRNSLWQSSDHNWSLLAVEEFLRTFIFQIFQSVNWWTTVKINCWRIII